MSRWLAGETAELHQKVEVALLPGGRLTRFDEVIRLVTVHQRVLAAYAQLIDAVLPIAGASPLTRWRTAAERDLRQWGGDIDASRGVNGSWIPSDHLVGVRYVIEGARMGLRLLSGDAELVLADAGKEPSALLQIDPVAGPRWHAVRRWLDSPDHDGADRMAVLGGAREAFSAYRPR